MTNNETNESDAAPIAASARSKRAGNSGDFVPTNVSAARPVEVAVDPALVAEKKAEQLAAKAARAEAAAQKSATRRARLKRNRVWIAVAGVLVLLGAGVAVAETVSANSGSAQPIVDEYIAAMNAGDPTVFADERLFPLPTGTSLLPEPLLGEIDTTLVGAESSIEPSSTGATATITASNLSQPIVLEIRKTVTLEGALLTPQWAVTTTLPTVTFAAAETLPTDAAVTVGASSLGVAGSAEFVAATSSTFAAPVGTFTVSTAATAVLDAASVEVTIVPGSNAVSFGGGSANAGAIIAAAISSGDWASLAPVMASQVSVLNSTSGAVGSPANLSGADAIAALEAAAGGASWSASLDPNQQATAKMWASTTGAGAFVGSTAIWASAPFSLEDGSGVSFLTLTLDDSGKIAKIWTGLNLLQLA